MLLSRLLTSTKLVSDVKKNHREGMCQSSRFHHYPHPKKGNIGIGLFLVKCCKPAFILVDSHSFNNQQSSLSI